VKSVKRAHLLDKDLGKLSKFVEPMKIVKIVSSPYLTTSHEQIAETPAE